MSKIKCTVHNCSHCDCECDCCKLKEIKVCNCDDNCDAKSTMCDSYDKEEE